MEMKNYIGIKQVLAVAMCLGEYNKYRGWTIPDDENPEDDGYLVEYTNAGKSNHTKHAGYISWCPKEQFENSNRCSESFLDRLYIEQEDLAGKIAKLREFTGSGAFKSLDANNQSLLTSQLDVMTSYSLILGKRIDLAVTPIKA